MGEMYGGLICMKNAAYNFDDVILDIHSSSGEIIFMR